MTQTDGSFCADYSANKPLLPSAFRIGPLSSAARRMPSPSGHGAVNWRKIAIALRTPVTGSMSEIAFHENAGLSQVDFELLS